MTDPASLLGPLDALGPYAEIVVLALVLVNLGTRLLADRSYRQQAAEGESLSRFMPHEVSNVVLVLGSFYLLTYDYNTGMVLSVLVVGLVIVDFFEFESRAVEARRDQSLEPPKAAIAGSMLVVGYIVYDIFFYLVAPLWRIFV